MKKNLIICFGIVFLLVGVGFVSSANLQSYMSSSSDTSIISIDGQALFKEIDIGKFPKDYLQINYYESEDVGKKLFVLNYLDMEEACNNLEEISFSLKQKDCCFSVNEGKKQYCSTFDKTFFENCYENGIIERKSWGNLCEENFECESDFCYENKCYRGGKDAYYENKINKLENQINSQEEEGNSSSRLTGAVVENQEKQNWFGRIWRKIFRKRD